MTTNNKLEVWSPYKKIFFRFGFAYFSLFLFSWPILETIPRLSSIHEIHSSILNTIVTFFNTHFFHFKAPLVPSIGGSDTSFGWAQQIFIITAAVFTAILWSLLDSKKANYKNLYAYLYVALRYFVAMIAFGYGIMKIFKIQMQFPNLHQLATPIGNATPALLFWEVIGYSGSFQICLGIAEVIVGLLLLHRKTTSLGTGIGFGVFFNVMLINLCYSIDAKIIAINLVLILAFLLLPLLLKLFRFYYLNENTFEHTIENKLKLFEKIRIPLKVIFIVLFVLIPIRNSYQIASIENPETPLKPIPRGIYMVANYVLNKDTIPILANDSLQWKDVIFDEKNVVSVNTSDQLLTHYMGRGYFYYNADTIHTKLNCYLYNTKNERVPLFTMHYKIKSNTQVHCNMIVNKDSVQFDLIKKRDPFRLSKKEFNWITETNE
jgi:hypothetical protein